MIYTVECSYTDSDSEAEWNDFYSLDKLPALISVTGFHTSQRFKAADPGCPTYLAVHSISGLDVLTSEEYRQKGGGNFARWQQHISDWHRNLYIGIDLAPAVEADELLVLSIEQAEPLVQIGLAPSSMQAVALEKFPERRWLAKLNRKDVGLIAHIPTGVHLYEPMTRQLTSARAAAEQPQEVRNA